MRSVSRDVIWVHSQIRVISSERRYPVPWGRIQSLRDAGQPVRRVPSRDGHPNVHAVDPASPYAHGDGAVNAPIWRGDSMLQSPDRAEGDDGDRSGCRRLLVMVVWRRCTRREVEQSVAFGTNHFLGEEGPAEATA